MIQEYKPSQALCNYITLLQERFLANFIYTTITLSHDYKLPAMKQLEGLSEDRIFNLVEIGIKAFFEDILKSNVLQGLYYMLDEWKNKTVGTEISSLSHKDIILGFIIRKQVLVQYLEYYNLSPEEYIGLAQELNELIQLIEKATLEYFQKDPVLKKML